MKSALPGMFFPFLTNDCVGVEFFRVHLIDFSVQGAPAYPEFLSRSGDISFRSRQRLKNELSLGFMKIKRARSLGKRLAGENARGVRSDRPLPHINSQIAHGHFWTR